ncbi:hypothetical protein [Carnobacterium maltaromaticum]|uniref:hypothetical protein n=1 Tax=Carnobacterium maltaromaticum TaxID=2751 RepID=UPI00054E2C29|nr:hypothetical protein [Carnobacterium maltaromaticum]AOA01445.1 hypothetical protein BFC23_02475 [Carnobacterium maltaromaticum]KRN60367.1 hypothetical protein IV70_GL001093 [Carnobacterium maltaromaticum DSM 20342]
MELTIYLKSGKIISVPGLKEIKYLHRGTWTTINSDFSEIPLNESLTYNFIGTNKVAMNAVEISYIDIQ